MFNNVKMLLKKLNEDLNSYYDNGKNVNIHIHVNRNDLCVRYNFIPEKASISNNHIYIEYNGIQTKINRDIENIIFDPDGDGSKSYLIKMGYMELYFDFV